MWLINMVLIPIFFAFDKIIYGLIVSFYNLFFEISNVSLLSDTTVSNFAQRIYVIIGVFMLFKVAISLITMMVSPDSMVKGGPKLIQKIMMSLVLLVAVPYIFTLAYRIQGIIISDNVLGNLILGATSNPDKIKEDYSNGGETIALQVFKGFFHPKNTSDNSVEVKTKEDCKTMEEDDEACIYATAEILDDFGKIIDSDKYSYSYLISTIAGGYVAWMLLTFCFDLAVRSVKLSFLQLIAPVPILANIDESKQNVFKNWVKECTSCFLSIFIRLITIYFIIFVISELVRNDGFGYYVFDAQTQEFVYKSGFSNWLLSAFVIIGLLMFAKQVPQLIESIFGIKSEKSFSANGLAMGLGFAGGAAVGALANAGNYALNRRKFIKEHAKDENGNWNEKTQAEFNKQFGRGLLGGASTFLGTTIGGAASTALRSGYTGYQGKKLGESIRTGHKASIQARNNRLSGYGLKDKFTDMTTNFTGSPQKFGSQSERAGRIKELMERKRNAELAEKTNAELFRANLQQVEPKYQAGISALYNPDKDGVMPEPDNIDWKAYVAQVGKIDSSDKDFDKKLQEFEANNSDQLVDRNTFEAINSAYKAQRSSDNAAQSIEKEITKLKEANDLGKKK